MGLLGPLRLDLPCLLRLPCLRPPCLRLPCLRLPCLRPPCLRPPCLRLPGLPDPVRPGLLPRGLPGLLERPGPRGWRRLPNQYLCPSPARPCRVLGRPVNWRDRHFDTVSPSPQNRRPRDEPRVWNRTPCR